MNVNFPSILLISFITFMVSGPLEAGTCTGVPQPGDIFREYHMVGGGANGSDQTWKNNHVFISHHTGEGSTPGDRLLENIDLTGAVGAEFVAIHWGGHVGSANRRVVINHYPAVNLPLIKHTPSMPECFFSQQCQVACEIPLAYLRQGENAFRLEVDNQICHSFDWGWFWTNQVILRIYYDADEVDHPVGSIAAPLSGEVLSDRPEVTCRTESEDVERIEFVGRYYDYSWEGSGDYYTWHWIHWMDDTRMQRHIGTAWGENRSVVWENEWIPDQKRIQIAARITDRRGLTYMTEAVSNVELQREDRIVRIYPASNVPEAFGTQTGTSECQIVIPDNLENALEAKLVMSTFSGGKPDRAVYLNGKLLKQGGWGVWHRLDICEEAVPVGMLKQGVNDFQIRADLPGEHAFEVNWPGPALIVAYGAGSDPR